MSDTLKMNEGLFTTNQQVIMDKLVRALAKELGNKVAVNNELNKLIENSFEKQYPSAGSLDYEHALNYFKLVKHGPTEAYRKYQDILNSTAYAMSPFTRLNISMMLKKIQQDKRYNREHFDDAFAFAKVDQWLVSRGRKPIIDAYVQYL